MKQPFPTSPEASNHVPHDSHELPYFETLFKAKQVEDSKEGVKRLESEREESNELMLKALESLTSTKDSLTRVIERLGGENDETFVVKEGERERLCGIRNW